MYSFPFSTNCFVTNTHDMLYFLKSMRNDKERVPTLKCPEKTRTSCLNSFGKSVIGSNKSTISRLLVNMFAYIRSFINNVYRYFKPAKKKPRPRIMCLDPRGVIVCNNSSIVVSKARKRKSNKESELLPLNEEIFYMN
jgi:hypothetical protein